MRVVMILGPLAHKTSQSWMSHKLSYASYSISKAIVSLLPSPCRATALSAARRLDTIDLEMELPCCVRISYSKKIAKEKPQLHIGVHLGCCMMVWVNLTYSQFLLFFYSICASFKGDRENYYF